MGGVRRVGGVRRMGGVGGAGRGGGGGGRSGRLRWRVDAVQAQGGQILCFL